MTLHWEEKSGGKKIPLGKTNTTCKQVNSSPENLVLMPTVIATMCKEQKEKLNLEEWEFCEEKLHQV